MSLTIRPINTGWVATSPKQYLYHPSVHKFYEPLENNDVDLPDYAFLIQGGPELMLVDTGMSWTERASKYHHEGSRQPEGMAIFEQLDKLGIDCKDIGIIALTHLHWDHAYYLDKFPNATIYVHEDELAFAKDPIPLYYKSYETEILNGFPPHFAAAHELTPIRGEFEFMPGVRAIETPGHSAGHMSIEVDTKDGNYILSGDSIFCEDNLKPVPQIKYDITPPGRFSDIVKTWHSIELQRDRVKDDSFILGAHFRSLVPRFEQTPVLG